MIRRWLGGVEGLRLVVIHVQIGRKVLSLLTMQWFSSNFGHC